MGNWKLWHDDERLDTDTRRLLHQRTDRPTLQNNDPGWLLPRLIRDTPQEDYAAAVLGVVFVMLLWGLAAVL